MFIPPKNKKSNNLHLSLRKRFLKLKKIISQKVTVCKIFFQKIKKIFFIRQIICQYYRRKKEKLDDSLEELKKFL